MYVLWCGLVEVANWYTGSCICFLFCTVVGSCYKCSTCSSSCCPNSVVVCLLQQDETAHYGHTTTAAFHTPKYNSLYLHKWYWQLQLPWQVPCLIIPRHEHVYFGVVRRTTTTTTMYMVWRFNLSTSSSCCSRSKVSSSHVYLCWILRRYVLHCTFPHREWMNNYYRTATV